MNDSNKRMAEYVADQLRDLPGVRSIPMMGGYVFYYNERIFGGIYTSGELLVKITKASKKYMPDSDPQAPYEGAKEMLPCTILENRELLCQMIEEMYPELPAKKERKKKADRG